MLPEFWRHTWCIGNYSVIWLRGNKTYCCTAAASCLDSPMTGSGGEEGYQKRRKNHQQKRVCSGFLTWPNPPAAATVQYVLCWCVGPRARVSILLHSSASSKMCFLKYLPVTASKYERVFFCEFGQRLQSDRKEWEKTSILSWNNCVAVCYEWLSLSSTPSFSPQMIALAPVVSSSSPHSLCSWSPGGRDSNTSHASLPVREVVIPEAKRTEDLLDKRLCYKSKNRKLRLKWQSYGARVSTIKPKWGKELTGCPV